MVMRFVREDGQRYCLNIATELAKKGKVNPELIPYITRAFEVLPLRESVTIVSGDLIACSGMFVITIIFHYYIQYCFILYIAVIGVVLFLAS